MKNKKTKIAIISVIALILVTIGITYAYWLVTKTQTDENEITAGCLDIAISGEKNDIELTNQFPMSDEDGMKLVPYEFTVTNNCNTSVDYQVALEATGTESSAITTSALKVALNDSISLLSSKAEVDTTIDGAYESRVLGYSRLAASGNEGSSNTYSLRIWIDENAPISEMNKTFRSKISVTIGQGMESPYEEGTLAYSILANVGGVNAASEIDSAVAEHKITATGNQYISPSNNYYYGTTYTLDKTTGNYKLDGTIVQAKLDECRNGTKTCGKYTLKNVSSTYESTTLFEIKDFQSSGNYVTANTWEYVNEFGEVTTANEAGLYKTQDDLGNSYYYRGAVTNNYVQFGTYAEDTTLTIYDYDTWSEKTVELKAETPMYWRIVRINGDGTIRLVYDGTTKEENGTKHTTIIGRSAYNSNSNDSKYVGYTYDDGNGNQVDSTIKGLVDEWYDTHLELNYGDKIADSIFCNDKSVGENVYYDSSYIPTTDQNAAVYTHINYGATKRLNKDKKPSLKCVNKSDRYTVNDTTNGNGLLSNPVGLITADEEVFAGASAGETNISYYLYSGDAYWIFSPYFFNVNESIAFVWYVGSGYLNSDVVACSDPFSKFGARPVINLKADVEFTGDGTIDNPYKIVTE